MGFRVLVIVYEWWQSLRRFRGLALLGGCTAVLGEKMTMHASVRASNLSFCVCFPPVPQSTNGDEKDYVFDRVFGPDSLQDEVATVLLRGCWRTLRVQD